MRGRFRGCVARGGLDRHECEFRSLLSASHSHSSLKLPGAATGYMTDPLALAGDGGRVGAAGAAGDLGSEPDHRVVLAPRPPLLPLAERVFRYLYALRADLLSA